MWCFFSSFLFFIMFLFYPFSPPPPCLSLCVPSTVSLKWESFSSLGIEGSIRPSLLRLFLAHRKKRISECMQGSFLFCLSSSTKMWCCYALPRLGWADLISSDRQWTLRNRGSSLVSLKCSKTKTPQQPIYTHVHAKTLFESKQLGGKAIPLPFTLAAGFKVCSFGFTKPVNIGKL